MSAVASSVTTKSINARNFIYCQDDVETEHDCNEYDVLNKVMSEYVSLRYRIHSGISKLDISLKSVEKNIK